MHQPWIQFTIPGDAEPCFMPVSGEGDQWGFDDGPYDILAHYGDIEDANGDCTPHPLVDQWIDTVLRKIMPMFTHPDFPDSITYQMPDGLYWEFFWHEDDPFQH
jgi:hypothetical protein